MSGANFVLMENYYLDWSELTRRVYITNGKNKKDVTEWFEKIVSERGGAKNISSNLSVSGQVCDFVLHNKQVRANGKCGQCGSDKLI